MVKTQHRSWLYRYFTNLNFIGLGVGFVFVYASFLPSLLPRGWILQGVLSAVLFCMGYGIGIISSYVIRQFKVSEPDTKQKTRFKKYAYWVLLVLYALALTLGANWQRQVNKLVGQAPENVTSVIGVIAVTILVIMFILFISRSIRSLYHWLKRQVLKVLPAKLAYAAAWTLALLLVVGLTNGVIISGVMDVLNQAYSIKNNTTNEGVTQPTSPELSGSPQSLISWDSLGRQGRNFISQVRPIQKISDFNGSPAKAPIRIYSGLESANSVSARAQLALDDLIRAGGFKRKIIVVVTTTGTGWVDQSGVNPIEYMYNGDSAIVAMQYSYLPSSLSFLVDQTKAKQAGLDLYNAVLGEWIKMPAASRPKLVVFGESLGSFGSETAFPGESTFLATSDGAVWAGPPNFNTLRRAATANRDAGSPEIKPIFQGGQTVRFMVQPSDLTNPDVNKWQQPRAVYLENSSDPIVWWSPNLLFHKPDWLKEPRGADVSTATTWLPFITFWQVSGDMVWSTGVPDGHGHKYGNLPTDAWSYVAPPPGWTQQKTDALKAELSK